MQNIAFIGLGKMGGPIAANLIKSGASLSVFDRSAAASATLVALGAQAHSSAREACTGADLVFLSLPGPSEVRQVLLGENGIADVLKKGTVVADLTTNAVAVVRELAATLRERDIYFLDCPVSGGVTGAASGKLAIWAAGDQTGYDKILPALTLIGDEISYIGESGAASIAKLVHNSASNVLNSVFAEMFALGVKAGLDATVLYDTIKNGALGRRRTFDGLPGQFLRNTYEPVAFEVDLARKDLTLAVDLGREVDVPLRFMNLALQDLIEANARGWGRDDFRKAMTLQLERAGVSIASPQ